MNIASQPATSTQSMANGVRRWAVRMIAFLLIFGAFLFLVAGRISWTAGWVYMGMNALTQLLSAVILIPRQSGMLAERSRVREGTKGAMGYTLLVPLVLGSWWASIPALVGAALIIVRTALEDRTLLAELTGCKEYAGSVRSRLVPGAW